MCKVKVSVIGLGHAGEVFHLPGLSRFEDVDLSICDIREERVREMSEKFGIADDKCYQDYQEMFSKEDPQAVFVLLPQYSLNREPGKKNDTNIYFQVVKESLSRGLAVLTEKPLAMTLPDAQVLADAAAKAGVVTMVSVNRRFNPLVQHCLKEVLKRGPVVSANCSFFKGSPHEYLWKGIIEYLVSDMIHALDLMRYLIGGEITEFYPSLAKSELDETPGSFYAMAISDNGATGAFSSNVTAGGRVQSWEIHGLGISCFIHDSFTPYNPTIIGGVHTEAQIITRHEQKLGPKIEQIHSTSSSELIKDTDLVNHPEEYAAYGGFTAADRYFIDCVKSGTQPHCNFADAVKTIDYCERILKSKLKVISVKKK